ncbi:hypothetical protein ACB087_16990 [Vibrio sp. VNB-15]
MLNKNSQLAILKALKKASTTVTLDDFDVNFADNQLITAIAFKHEKGYVFEVTQKERFEAGTVTDKNKFSSLIGDKEYTLKTLTSRYDINVCPGKTSLHETWHAKEFDDIAESNCVTSYIRSWVRYLEKELTITDWAEEQEKHQTQKEKVKACIAQHLKPYIDDTNARFGSSEVIEITEKLEQLVSALENNDSFLTNEELERLKRVVDDASKTLSTFKKGTWFEVTTNKFAQWASGIDKATRFIEAVDRLSSFVEM